MHSSFAIVMGVVATAIIVQIVCFPTVPSGSQKTAKPISSFLP